MTQSNMLVQTAGQLEKLFTMVLWKLQKDKPVSLTEQDIKDFMAAHDHGAAMTDKEIADINDSWELALLHHGISPQEVRELRQTVEDAIANNME